MIRWILGIFFLGTIAFSCNNSAAKDDAIAQDTISEANPTHWAGTYRGTIPDNNSVGLDMTLSLLPSNTYELKIIYLEKDPKNNKEQSVRGEIEWAEDSSTIVLNELDSISNKFKIKPNIIEYLNPDATPNSGDLAEFYILKKQ